MSTNNCTQANWETDRPKPEDARWSGTHGVPVEIMCKLANTIHADPWFNLPHLATDDYMTQFATVIGAPVVGQLDADLHVYIEYSNETWNGQFSDQSGQTGGQTQYVRDQGMALELYPDPPDPPDPSNPPDRSESAAGACFSSQRSVQMFGIFEGVMYPDSHTSMPRLKRVLATQAAGWYYGEMKVAYDDAYEHADVLAIAPYFGSVYSEYDRAAATAAMTVNELFDSINSDELQDDNDDGVYRWVDKNAGSNVNHGLELVAYEGGQSLLRYYGENEDFYNEKLIPLYADANRDPRMGQIYDSYLSEWKSRGGGMFVHYLNCLNYSEWGFWGSLERLDQYPATAPKYSVLQQFIKDNRQ